MVVDPLAKSIHAYAVDDQNKAGNDGRAHETQNRNGLHESGPQDQAPGSDRDLGRLKSDVEPRLARLVDGLLDFGADLWVAANVSGHRASQVSEKASLKLRLLSEFVAVLHPFGAGELIEQACVPTIPEAMVDRM